MPFVRQPHAESQNDLDKTQRVPERHRAAQTAEQRSQCTATTHPNRHSRCAGTLLGGVTCLCILLLCIYN